MRKAISLLLLLCLYLYLAPKLGYLGGVWSSHAQPYKDVTIEFEDGQRERGALLLNLDRSYTLLLDDGRSLTFNHFRQMISSKSDEKRSLWRSMLPLTAFSGLYAGAVLWIGFGRRRIDSYRVTA